MSAPMPLNFATLSATWDDPEAYAAALNAYYAQLREQGYNIPPVDITEPTKGTS